MEPAEEVEGDGVSITHFLPSLKENSTTHFCFFVVWHNMALEHHRAVSHCRLRPDTTWPLSIIEQPSTADSNHSTWEKKRTWHSLVCMEQRPSLRVTKALTILLLHWMAVKKYRKNISFHVLLGWRKASETASDTAWLLSIAEHWLEFSTVNSEHPACEKKFNSSRTWHSLVSQRISSDLK